MSQLQTPLAAATGAANSSPIQVHNVPITVSVFPEANLASETGDLAKLNSQGTYDDVYKDGSQVQLSATNPQVTIYGGGTYRVECAARTSAWGVDMIEAPKGY